jgi:hypothetical protein
MSGASVGQIEKIKNKIPDAPANARVWPAEAELNMTKEVRPVLGSFGKILFSQRRNLQID